MKYLTCILFLSVTLIFQSCEQIEGCSDISLGSFSLDNSTKGMFSFEEGNSLVFKNQVGDESVFTNSSWLKENTAAVTFFDCNGNTQNILYSGDLGSFRFTNELFDIVMTYTMAYVAEGDPSANNIVDVATFKLVHPSDGFMATMTVVPFTRGATELSEIEKYETFQNLSLNGNLYSDGFRSIESDPENLVDLYVSPTTGIIGFTDMDGNTYSFDRFQ